MTVPKTTHSGRILGTPVPMLTPRSGPVHVLLLGEAPGPRGQPSGVMRDRDTNEIIRWWFGKCGIREPQPCLPQTACYDWCGEHTPKDEAND